jgi:hypothetical protein
VTIFANLNFSHHINKSIPHRTLIQIFEKNFNNLRDHSDLLPPAAMMEMVNTSQVQQQQTSTVQTQQRKLIKIEKSSQMGLKILPQKTRFSRVCGTLSRFI